MKIAQRLCVICVRGGSRGVSAKGLRKVSGLSLIEISIRQAKESGLFAAIAFSSDSQAMLNEAQRCGADVLVDRPLEMASDHAPKIPAVRHCVLGAETNLAKEFQTIVDLDVTSPLRLAEDIRGAVSLLEESRCDNVITGCEAHRSPYFNLVEETETGTIVLSKGSTIVRRQDCPKSYDMNASIYVWQRSALLNPDAKLFNPTTRLFKMPRERSWDIDSEFDLDVVNFIATKHRRFAHEW